MQWQAPTASLDSPEVTNQEELRVDCRQIIGTKLICEKRSHFLGKQHQTRFHFLTVTGQWKKILPLNAGTDICVTSLLRSAWNYKQTPEQQVPARSHHKHCPHALESGALKPPHSFTAPSSSPLPFMQDSISLQGTFTDTDFSQRCHGPCDRWPQSCCSDILSVCQWKPADSKKTKKLMKKNSKITQESSCNVKEEMNRAREPEGSAFNHNSLPGPVCVLI